MHDAEQERTTQQAETQQTEHSADSQAGTSTTKFSSGGAKPPVHGGFTDHPQSASDRAYADDSPTAAALAQARQSGDREVLLSVVRKILELARTSEPATAARLIESLYAAGIDVQFPAVAAAIRETLAVVQHQAATGASGVAHGAATAVSGTANAGAHGAAQQQNGGIAHATTQAQPQHDAGTQQQPNGTTGAQATSTGPAKNSQGEEIAGGPDAKQGVHIGGNDAHAGGVQEGMKIDGWRVYATTARKIQGTHGTIAWQDNNPGNLTVEPSHINDGGMFGDYKYTDGTFRVFPTYAAGRAAIATYFRAWQHRKPGITLEDVVHFYGNQTAASQQIYRDKWTHAAGVPNTTKIEDLSDAQLEAITVAIVGQEGTVPGIEKPRTDPSLPDGVYTGTR